MEIHNDVKHKMTELPITVIILTYNEEKNIADCLKSVYGWVKEIFIVDSFSTDRTLELVKQYTDRIYQYPFETQAKQINWALENLPIKTEWIMRLDADEKVTPELKDELIRKLNMLNQEISGIYVKRRVYFMDRWMKYGGYYPTWLLRIWRKNKGFYEERQMDEHIKITEGKTLLLNHDIIDYNKNNLSRWINKHNNYATREAIEILDLKYNLFNYEKNQAKFFAGQEYRKRWLKEKFYVRLPLFVRSFLYFIYQIFYKIWIFRWKRRVNMVSLPGILVPSPCRCQNL